MKKANLNVNTGAQSLWVLESSTMPFCFVKCTNQEKGDDFDVNIEPGLNGAAVFNSFDEALRWALSENLHTITTPVTSFDVIERQARQDEVRKQQNEELKKLN